MLRNRVSGLRGGSNDVEGWIFLIGIILTVLFLIGYGIYYGIQKARGKKPADLNVSVPKPVPKYRM